MKKITLGIFLGLILMSCKYKDNHTDTKVKCVIDSVEYHGVGYDNTLQLTPYWKLYLKEPQLKIRSYKPYDKGDTIYIIKRKINK